MFEMYIYKSHFILVFLNKTLDLQKPLSYTHKYNFTVSACPQVKGYIFRR